MIQEAVELSLQQGQQQLKKEMVSQEKHIGKLEQCITSAEDDIQEGQVHT